MPFKFNPITGKLDLVNGNLYSVLKDPTGFDIPENVIVNYDSTTRKITLTGTFVSYWQGSVIPALTTGWVSDAHGTGTGTWFLYYNGSAFVWSQLPWTFDMLQIAYVYYGATDKFAIREAHGFMPWSTHEEFHETIGAYNDGGGDISAYTLNSTTPANRRPDISTTIVKDEDNLTTNPAHTSKLYTKEFLTGTGTNNFTVETAEIVPVLAANPYYNKWDGAAWIQTLMANNTYMCVWLVAVPACAGTNCQKYRYIWVQGQSNGTLASQQALNPPSLNLGSLKSVFSEFVFIGKVIIRFTAANWTIVQVDKLTGNNFSQTSIIGGYISSVVHDDTLIGNGTSGNPLGVNKSFVIAMAIAL